MQISQALEISISQKSLSHSLRMTNVLMRIMIPRIFIITARPTGSDCWSAVTQQHGYLLHNGRFYSSKTKICTSTKQSASITVAHIEAINLCVNTDQLQPVITGHEPDKVNNRRASSAGASQFHHAANWHWISGTDERWSVLGRVWKIWHKSTSWKVRVRLKYSMIWSE